MTPTLHKPIPMGTRVRTGSGAGASSSAYPLVVGEVVGIASMHIVFGYIVLLDTPLASPEGEVRAIVVSGPGLSSEDGKTHWRLE